MVKVACTGWFAFRPSTPPSAATPPSRRSSSVRKSTTPSPSRSSPTSCAPTLISSGKGGQHVNTTDSAVRITHIPTGTVAQCQNERSQHRNREVAMKMLRSRLYEMELRRRRQVSDKLEASKADIDFGSQIRSYVLHPYRLVKDHRTKFEVGDADKVLNGGLDPFIKSYLLSQREGVKATG